MDYDIIIIGGGCAGMSAAVYAASRGKTVLLLEKEAVTGGTINHVSTITHFMGAKVPESGRDLAARMASQLNYPNITVKQEQVINARFEDDIKLVVTADHEYHAKRVIIAAGTAQREAEFAGTDAEGRPYISHDAAADGSRYAGKTVFVIGGSDGAAKEALYLSGIAGKVVIVAVEKTLSAIPEFSERIAAALNIEVFTDSSITGVSENGGLESVEMTVLNSGEKHLMEAPNGGIFVYAGSLPNTEWCNGIKLNDGYVETDAVMQTNLPGVYAIGDIRAKPFRQISTAIADGTIAAIHACVTIQEG